MAIANQTEKCKMSVNQVSGMAYNISVRLDVIHQKSPANMDEVEDGSIQMVLTLLPAPRKDEGLPDYLSRLNGVFAECTRALTSGGRLAIIVPVALRKLDYSSPAAITSAIMEMGLSMRGEIIWNRGASLIPSSWGGWVSPSNPTLWDIHEHILLFSKGSRRLEPRIPGSRPDISSVEFIEWSKSVWDVPMPHEITRRLIKIYTYPGDIILDPFTGTGTVAAVASALGRHYIGYEEDEEACHKARAMVRVMNKGLF